MKIAKKLTYPLLVVVFTLVAVGIAHAAGFVDPTNKWAWGTNVGWINFDPADSNVVVYDDHLEGYAWGENIGWIRLGTYEGGDAHTYANTAADNYGVNNDGNGNLSGYAWGTNVGWINFNPAHSQVTIDPATGSMNGYAWGENIGWISFRGGDDFAYNVVINFAASALPATGFPQGAVAALPAQPPEMAYNETDILLDIPALDLKLPVVGVPLTENGWEVAWLGQSAGYLEGTAFPTTAGNTGITAHVWDANNNPGPFAKLKNLRYGGVIKIHAWGYVYTYAVRYNYLTTPENTNPLRHEDYDWITLLTCERYSPTFETYRFRRVVRAVLVDVSPE